MATKSPLSGDSSNRVAITNSCVFGSCLWYSLMSPLAGGLRVLFISFGGDLVVGCWEKLSWLRIIGVEACYGRVGEHNLAVLAPKLGHQGCSAWHDHARGTTYPCPPLSCFVACFSISKCPRSWYEPLVAHAKSCAKSLCLWMHPKLRFSCPANK